MAQNQSIYRWEGAILFGLLVVYILLNIRLARQGKEQELTEEFDHHLPHQQKPLRVDLVWMGAGLGLLIGGSHLLVTGAVNLAEEAGVSPALIGLTIVAAGTGLPELATSVVAAIKKEPDLAVGNIVGSNIFNLLCIGGITPMVKTIRFPHLEMMDFAVMTGLAIILFPISWTGMRLGRREGLLLLMCYGAYLYMIWPHAI